VGRGSSDCADAGGCFQLTNQSDVRAFFEQDKPDQVYLAAACVHVMNLDQATYNAHTSAMQSHINVGSGKDITIKELAQTIVKVIGYQGSITFDPTKSDGTPRKLMSTRLNNLGGKPASLLNKACASPTTIFYRC